MATAAFDLATLLFYFDDADAVRPQLWRAILDRTGPERASVYLAHMMLRQVEWVARQGGPGVAMYLDVSSRILADLRARA